MLRNFEYFQNRGESVRLTPSETAGLFQIVVGDTMVFDRKTHGGFMEIKTVKRRVRDLIIPTRSLGHIDT